MHAFIPHDNNISLRTQIIYGTQDQLKLNKTNKELRNLSKKRKALPDEGISLNIKPPISGASRSISHRVRVIVHSSQPKTIARAATTGAPRHCVAAGEKPQKCSS
jgi:hypothetical protein